MTNTELTEPDTRRALESVMSRARAKDQRRRWVAIGAAVAVAATVVGVLVLAPLLGDGNNPPQPAGRPSTSTSASAPDETARIIAEGRLVSYAADASGAVLTLWKSGSYYAWSLLRDGHSQATGRANLAGRGIDQEDSGQVYPGGGGFVVSPAFDTFNAQGETRFVAADGTVTVLRSDCEAVGPAAGAPGRYVVTKGNFPGLRIVDTVAGTYCAQSKVAGRELIATETVFARDGTLWGVTDEPKSGEATLAWYDGSRWRNHDLVGGSNTAENTTVVPAPARTISGAVWRLAVGDAMIAVLQGDDAAMTEGLTISTDNGATWSEVTATTLPFENHNSIAFAGRSSLFVADNAGGLWRSTDWADFRRVETPEPVFGLQPAGDRVIARIGRAGADDLVLIAADGTVQPLVIR